MGGVAVAGWGTGPLRFCSDCCLLLGFISSSFHCPLATRSPGRAGSSCTLWLRDTASQPHNGVGDLFPSSPEATWMG